MELLPKDIIEKSLGVPLSENAFLVTIHPETLHPEKNRELVTETLGALEQLENVLLIFTAANQDAGGSKINAALQDFCSAHSHARFFESLGTELYLSVMAHSRAVLGNSSSGIFEAPALGIPTINIGSRQDGRIREVSVADVAASKEAILDALSKTMSRGTGEVDQPRDNSSLSPLPSQIITHVLETSDFGQLRDKGFVDITDIGLTL
jgi:UDP-hydrolysing UDP-N-acetyl-D-glucosamine 2-epimerase